MVSLSVRQLVCPLVGQSVRRLVGQSVSWLVGQSVSWLVGQSVRRLVGQSVSPSVVLLDILLKFSDAAVVEDVVVEDNRAEEEEIDGGVSLKQVLHELSWLKSILAIQVGDRNVRINNLS